MCNSPLLDLMLNPCHLEIHYVSLALLCRAPQAKQPRVATLWSDDGTISCSWVSWCHAILRCEGVDLEIPKRKLINLVGAMAGYHTIKGFATMGHTAQETLETITGTISLLSHVSASTHRFPCPSVGQHSFIWLLNLNFICCRPNHKQHTQTQIP